ncbi:fumarylacetoacetate hydrolase family protein [Ramlibacter sp.]|uniref:fumarylacetoacetate hydrolase family protein n=1 Tax=Ramlibacter sp. TaxID=1917967 RepID=UPI00260E0835|nr:fumarylacetoacetate hydrolase family protein [Ramlibacter sp.]MDB5956123.1 5-oxopent-3-ene,2,5-tricarboxylate decarboxylase [Ramlibacter sp.]
MRFVSLLRAGVPVVGCVEQQEVVVLPAPASGEGLVGWLMQPKPQVERALAQARANAANVMPLAQAKLLPAVQRPGKIVCLGLNYADHAAEGGHKKPEYPSFFLRVPSSLAAHGEPLLRPRVSDRFDWEAELAVIIGKPGRHLTESNALAVVAGYTCFNDGSLRDYQRKTSQWTIGKNFDRTGPLGPWVVPASELPPGATGLKIESRLNGQVMQSSNTSNMLFPVVETLCLLTEVMTLEPGDVIAMGTPSGVGYARTPPVFMKAGDRIEIDIEKIGVLANTIVDEEAA